MRMFFQRTRRRVARCGNTRRIRFASGSCCGKVMTYVGERCSMVTCAAVCDIAGTSVTAVAPLPMTTTFLPGIVEIFRPMLRMDEASAETFGAGKGWLVTCVVAVVARASVEKVARVADGFTAVASCFDDPARVLR